MPALFDSLTLRSMAMRNRIVMSPMCMYSAGEDAVATDFHLVHLGARAMGGVGLIITEATAVESRGRISARDLGLYADRQVAALQRITAFAHDYGATICTQLAHAGRKAWSQTKGQGPETPVSASPIPFDTDWVTPQELDSAGIEKIVTAFSDATQRAQAAGFDAIEIHGAHGYLIHEFLSPLSNQRRDAYGGSLDNRMRFLLRVVDAVRAVWPAEKPMLVRLSCTEWVDGGLTVSDILHVAQALKERHVDLIDCSTGGNAARQTIPLGPGYQVAFAAEIRRDIGIPTGAVGLISTPELANEIIHNGRADVVLLGRELLRDPNWALHAARRMSVDVAWPTPYLRARK